MPPRSWAWEYVKPFASCYARSMKMSTASISWRAGMPWTAKRSSARPRRAAVSLAEMGDGKEQYGIDREPTLAELLAGLDTTRLLAALQALLDGPLLLTDVEGKTLLGKDLPHAMRRVPVCVDMEALGILESAAPQQTVVVCAQLLEMILRSAARYRMAADLHLATVREDYDELRRRHDALQVSEARYRELATTVEQRGAGRGRARGGARRRRGRAGGGGAGG